MICVMCPTEIIKPKTGRPKRFCSDSCRLHHHRSKPRSTQRNSIDYTDREKIIAEYKEAMFRCVLRREKFRFIGPGATQRKRPLALDLFCGDGGAAMGLYAAGFDVIGVDIVPRPDYPFLFIQADATKPPFDLSIFDFIWASTPCQMYSVCNNFLKKDYPDLVSTTRVLLRSAALPYIMENVPAAPFIEPVALTGDMFGLSIIRRRHFESNIALSVPLHSPGRGSVKRGDCFTVAGNGGRGGNLSDWRDAMGIDWMKKKTLVQAVPPAYSWYLAKQLIKIIYAKRDII